MLQFFKYVLASVVGIIVSVFLLLVLTIVIATSIAAVNNKKVVTKENSILTIDLNKDIKERSGIEPMNFLSSPSSLFTKKIGLHDILKVLSRAKIDNNIKGIYLKGGDAPSGLAIADELRAALKRFKTSGKFIVSYSEVYSQKSYYLASVSDTVYLNPQGLLEFKGLSAVMMFYKGAFEKLKLKPQVFRHGKFKSFVEPYTRENMSEANKEQGNSLLSSIWNSMLTKISESRSLSIATLNNLADSLLVRNAEDAVKYGLADKIVFEDEFKSSLKKEVGIDEDDKLKFISINSYAQLLPPPDLFSKNKVAVIYATGVIKSKAQQFDDESLVASKICKSIKRARNDDNVKAIVLRINSPGGSALASDVIWREVVLTAAEKPIVASMSNVAASGGYYIACAADTIISGENTITGSIGVFGLLMNMKGFYKMLGLTFDRIKTNDLSDFADGTRKMTELEREIIQERIEEIYDDFISKVGDGRNMSKVDVDSVGQGRVWSGTDAINQGLVDINGGLMKSLEVAASMADLENYTVIELPKQLEPMEQLISDLSNNYETKIIEHQMGEYYYQWKLFHSLKDQSGILTKMPYDIEFN